MKKILTIVPLQLLATTLLAATNLVSNTAIVTNRVQGIVTYTMSNGVARVQDPSGKLVGTAEERALKVAAEGQVDIASAAADAAGTAMEEWREFTATTDVKVCYIDAGFTQDLPALAPNLCGWVAGSFYDREKGEDHYYVWFNREIDYPLSMCARIVSESGTNWLDGAWVDWAVTNWIDKATGREWTRPYQAEVEYLESDSKKSKYIDTLIVVRDGYEVAVDIMPNEITGDLFIGDGLNTANGVGVGVRLFNYSGKIYVDQFPVASATSPGRIIAGSMPVGERGVYRYGNQYVYKNGVLISEQPKVDLITSTSVKFLLGVERTYSFKLSQDGNVVIDSIPVLDLAGRPAMYDRVSGRLLYNQGEGEFSYGPVTAAPVPCRELVVPRRNANCVLKTGTVITLGGRDGFDADIHKVNIEIGGTPTPTTSAQLPLFYAVTRSGTNRVTRAYTNGFLNVENGFIKEPSNE